MFGQYVLIISATYPHLAFLTLFSGTWYKSSKWPRQSACTSGSLSQNKGFWVLKACNSQYWHT